MDMPYIKRITTAGRIKEIELYFSSRYNKKGAKRSDKVKPTSEQQKKINMRRRARWLRLLTAENFGYGDYHVVLSYVRRKDVPHRTKKEMRRDIEKFFRECRKQYRKQGKELKYIHVMEIGERGGRHHHLVMNEIEPKILQTAWNKVYEGQSRIHITVMDDSGEYKKLAEYFIKQSAKYLNTEKELMGKSYSTSKNLRKPKVEYKIVSDRSWFRAVPKIEKGYYLDKESEERGVHSPEYYGYGFYRYTLIKNTRKRE